MKNPESSLLENSGCLCVLTSLEARTKRQRKCYFQDDREKSEENLNYRYGLNETDVPNDLEVLTFQELVLSV